MVVERKGWRNHSVEDESRSAGIRDFGQDKIVKNKSMKDGKSAILLCAYSPIKLVMLKYVDEIVFLQRERLCLWQTFLGRSGIDW